MSVKSSSSKYLFLQLFIYESNSKLFFSPGKEPPSQRPPTHHYWGPLETSWKFTELHQEN